MCKLNHDWTYQTNVEAERSHKRNKIQLKPAKPIGRQFLVQVEKNESLN